MTWYKNDRTGKITISLIEVWNWHKRGDSVSYWINEKYIGKVFKT